MHVTAANGRRSGDARLLDHLRALDRLVEERPPAAERLERELGQELARTLVAALTRGSRRVGAAA
jgi:ubiquinone biosynthesis protein UbiJ